VLGLERGDAKTDDMKKTHGPGLPSICCTYRGQRSSQRVPRKRPENMTANRCSRYRGGRRDAKRSTKKGGQGLTKNERRRKLVTGTGTNGGGERKAAKPKNGKSNLKGETRELFLGPRTTWKKVDTPLRSAALAVRPKEGKTIRSGKSTKKTGRAGEKRKEQERRDGPTKKGLRKNQLFNSGGLREKRKGRGQRAPEKLRASQGSRGATKMAIRGKGTGPARTGEESWNQISFARLNTWT